jgi:hypothetical protein
LDVLALLQTSNNFQVHTPTLVTMLKLWQLSWLTWSLHLHDYRFILHCKVLLSTYLFMQILCITWQKYRIHSDCLSFLCYVGWRWTSSVGLSRCGPRRTEPCPWVQYNNDHCFLLYAVKLLTRINRTYKMRCKWVWKSVAMCVLHIKHKAGYLHMEYTFDSKEASHLLDSLIQCKTNLAAPVEPSTKMWQ